MKEFKPPIATDTGLMAQLAYFSSKKPLVLTKMAIGSGRPSDPSDIPKMKQLINEEKEISITELTLDDENPCVTVCGVIDYMEVTTPFEVCELGLFIIDPITDHEVLYCYTYSDRGELAPAMVRATELISISTLISRTQEITVPEYNRLPYVLRHELNLLKTVISTDVPDDVYGLWLKPLGKIENWDNWDNWGGVSGGVGNTSYTASVLLSGCHYSITQPVDKDVVWFMPEVISGEADG